MTAKHEEGRSERMTTSETFHAGKLVIYLQLGAASPMVCAPGCSPGLCSPFRCAPSHSPCFCLCRRPTLPVFAGRETWCSTTCIAAIRRAFPRSSSHRRHTTPHCRTRRGCTSQAPRIRRWVMRVLARCPLLQSPTLSLMQTPATVSVSPSLAARFGHVCACVSLCPSIWPSVSVRLPRPSQSNPVLDLGLAYRRSARVAKTAAPYRFRSSVFLAPHYVLRATHFAGAM